MRRAKACDNGLGASSDSDSDNNGGDGGITEEDEGCPSGCDGRLFQRVVSLRTQRLDVEDAITRVANSIDAMHRERDSTLKKLKLLNQSLASVTQVGL